MNIVKYNKKINRETFICWILIAVILTIGYSTELLNEARTVDFTIQFFGALWLPLFISYGASLIIGTDNLNIKYAVSIGYTIFYAFALMTAKDAQVWVYILPMISVLMIYNDTRLIQGTMGVSLILNVVQILLFSQRTKGYIHTRVDIEIQLAVLILTVVFVSKVSKILSYGNTKLIQLNEEITKDELTSTYNRYFLTNFIEEKFKEPDSNDCKSELSLAIIDIDNFKKINDTYGHRFGDLVLKKIANILIKNTNDIVDTHIVRLGGDEFAIISTLLTKGEVYDISVKCCKQIDEAELQYGDTKVKFNVSIGVANNKSDGANSFSDLYIAADELLYKAKHCGKNSVVKE